MLTDRVTCACPISLSQQQLHFCKETFRLLGRVRCTRDVLPSTILISTQMRAIQVFFRSPAPSQPPLQGSYIREGWECRGPRSLFDDGI